MHCHQAAALVTLFSAITSALDKAEMIQHCEQVMCEEQYLEVTEICGGQLDKCPEIWIEFQNCMKPCLHREMKEQGVRTVSYEKLMAKMQREIMDSAELYA